MASLLRQIVAGPRSRHPEAGLDLCYVTSQIIATSGPSGTYPQRAYRNPLDQLVKFLDEKHGKDWAIWEFRAEGTGYPDEEVYGRVWHYPWPDHHPPPFKLVPMIVAGMRNWLARADEEGKTTVENEDQETKEKNDGMGKGVGKGNGRVVVVHCKAGKGRSGTMACSYLISECGWKPSEALARFTERRMRPGFGQGVSIPSQLRWVGYVDRWTRAGKVYVERQIEVLEVHAWGLRDGVKVQVEGYVDDGKLIKLFHVFSKQERVVVDRKSSGKGSLTEEKPQGVPKAKTTGQLDASTNSEPRPVPPRDDSSVYYAGEEAGGGAVIFKPSTPVILPSSDINIDLERRNKASMGWTMVTSVAHVWFNAFFEGNGPEQGGVPDDNGVFEIDWEKMDGIKGSSRKGTRALDKLAVVWRAYNTDPGRGRVGDIIHQPGTDSPVPQMKAADWKQSEDGDGQDSKPSKGLGLRTESPGSADISKASSIKSSHSHGTDNESVDGTRSGGMDGGEHDAEHVDVSSLPQPQATGLEYSLEAVKQGLDTASGTTLERGHQLSDPTPRAAQEREASLKTSAPTLGANPDPHTLVASPEPLSTDDLKVAKDHKLGHISSVKKTTSS